MSFPLLQSTPKFGIALELGSKRGSYYPVTQELQAAPPPGVEKSPKDESVKGTRVTPIPGSATWQKADQTSETGQVVFAPNLTVFLSGDDLAAYNASGQNKQRIVDLYA